MSMHPPPVKPVLPSLLVLGNNAGIAAETEHDGAPARAGGRTRRLPEWLKRPIPAAGGMSFTRSLVAELRLETVCENARCPNRPECYSRRTATFMILGNVCTRPCGFCSVPRGEPLELEDDEPARRRRGRCPARSAARGHYVGHPRRSCRRRRRPFLSHNDAVRQRTGAVVEVLTPDFLGDYAAIDRVLAARPEVYNHNMETVPRLYKKVRGRAEYQRSLDLLAYVKQHAPETVTKSGLMLGLGETTEEWLDVLADLRASAAIRSTLGQYLRHLPAYSRQRYVPPAEFDDLAGWREPGLRSGRQRPLCSLELSCRSDGRRPRTARRATSPTEPEHPARAARSEGRSCGSVGLKLRPVASPLKRCLRIGSAGGHVLQRLALEARGGDFQRVSAVAKRRQPELPDRVSLYPVSTRGTGRDLSAVWQAVMPHFGIDRCARDRFALVGDDPAGNRIALIEHNLDLGEPQVRADRHLRLSKSPSGTFHLERIHPLGQTGNLEPAIGLGRATKLRRQRNELVAAGARR